MNKSARVAVVAGSLLLLLSGCVSGPAPESEEREIPEVSIDGLDNVVATLDYDTGTVALPSDAYDIEAPEYEVRVFHAIAVRADQCMVGKGFEAIADKTNWKPYPKEDDRLFGLWSPKLTSIYGGDRAEGAGPPEESLDGYGPEFNNAYNGCTEHAKTTLKKELDAAQGLYVGWNIRAKAAHMAKDSEAGKQALEDWRACSKAAGLVLDPENDLPVQEYVSQGKESEIKAFTTHAECARSTHAIQTLYDLQARYETALIDAQQAKLVELVTQRDEVMAAFDAAIAGR